MGKFNVGQPVLIAENHLDKFHHGYHVRTMLVVAKGGTPGTIAVEDEGGRVVADRNNNVIFPEEWFVPA